MTGPAARIAPRPQPEGDPASFVVMGWGGPGGITPYGLARRSLGSQVLWLFGVSASAPMTVLAGGTVATFAATGVIAVPLSFPLLAVALGLFAIGYTRLARDVPHAATFAALLTHGLGRTVGAAAAFVAVLSYNCVQIGLYGLLGATLAGQLGGPWWGWALAAWTVVAVIGYRGVTLGAPVVAVVLTLELGMIVLFESWRSPIPRRPKPVRGCSPGAPTCSPSTGWAGCSPSASRRSSGSRPRGVRGGGALRPLGRPRYGPVPGVPRDLLRDLGVGAGRRRRPRPHRRRRPRPGLGDPLAHLGPVWAQHTPVWATTPVAATARTDLADAHSALAAMHRQLRRVEPAWSHA